MREWAEVNLHQEARGVPASRGGAGDHLHAPSPEAMARWLEDRGDQVTRRGDAAEAVVAAIGHEVKLAAVARAHEKAHREEERREAMREEGYEGESGSAGGGGGDYDDGPPPETLPPRVSRGAAAVREVLGDTVTDEDLERQLEDDVNHLVWYPVPPPEEARAQSVLGAAPRGRADCFACMAGGASAAPAAVAVANITSIWRSQWAYAAPEALALTIERYYEESVRKPANRAASMASLGFAGDREGGGGRRRGVQTLGKWSAASIYEHFTQHVCDPETYFAQSIRELSTIKRHLYLEGSFMANSRDPTDRRVSEKRLNMLLKCCAQLKQLHAGAAAAGVRPHAAGGVFLPPFAGVSRAAGGGKEGEDPAMNPAMRVGGFGSAASQRSVLQGYFPREGGGGRPGQL